MSCVSPWYNCTCWLGVKHQPTASLWKKENTFLKKKFVGTQTCINLVLLFPGMGIHTKNTAYDRTLVKVQEKVIPLNFQTAADTGQGCEVHRSHPPVVAALHPVPFSWLRLVANIEAQLADLMLPCEMHSRLSPLQSNPDVMCRHHCGFGSAEAAPTCFLNENKTVRNFINSTASTVVLHSLLLPWSKQSKKSSPV